MEQVEQQPRTPHTNIAAKLVQVMKACGYIQKDSQNKEQKYSYVSAAAVLEKVNAALVENKLVSIPRFEIVSEKEKQTSRGGVWQLVTVQCTLHLYDAESGETLTFTSLGTGTDPGDKAVAKAQTMALKYAWLTTLNIGTGDEPEADERKHEFYNQPQQPPIQDDSLYYLVPPGLPNTPLVQKICQFWRGLGWDVNMLQSHLEERFKKPINQITDTEMTAVANDAQAHYEWRESQGGGQA